VINDREALKEGGIDPDNLLFFKFSDVKEANCPKDDGMDPLK